MKALVFTVIFLMPLICSSQDKNKGFPSTYTDIDQLIKQKKNNKKQQSYLISFKNTYGKNNKLTVSEFKDHYEIIVTHPGEEGYTGGAEAYKLDKETGKSEMIWHEHPMKTEIIEEEKNE